ncbi:MAG: SulP family inorganic anion transporter [Chromatiales bacterium]|nr:SulP family inorganic anion transporter [Chromatiales bacterium]
MCRLAAVPVYRPLLHGVWLLVFVSLLPSVLNLVPTASLAALLVYTGYKLAYPKVVKELLKYGKSEVAIYLVTIGVIVHSSLLDGVLVGPWTVHLQAAVCLLALGDPPGRG